uniref:T-complex protein 11-like protein 2 n=1 Tax=Lygus hesperus TaxID=30085 RepID=A0A0A9WVL1_LYGHE
MSGKHDTTNSDSSSPSDAGYANGKKTALNLEDHTDTNAANMYTNTSFALTSEKIFDNNNSITLPTCNESTLATTLGAIEEKANYILCAFQRRHMLELRKNELACFPPPLPGGMPTAQNRLTNKPNKKQPSAPS